MSLGNQSNIMIIVLLGLAAIAFIVAGLASARKWRLMYHAARAEHARHAEVAARELRDARQRIAELERVSGSAQQQAEPLAGAVEPAAPVPEQETLEAAAVARLPFEPTAETPVSPVVAPSVEPPSAEIDHLPIPPESPADSSAPRPVVSLEQFLSELPPAPTGAITPLRAPDPTPPVEERQVASVAEADPATAGQVTDSAAPTVTITDPTAAPVEPAIVEAGKSWFGSGRRDNLNRLRGVDALITNRLFALGVTTYDDIVQLSQEDEIALEQRLGLPAGLITREQWRAQAGLLRLGREDEFNERFGKLPA